MEDNLSVIDIRIKLKKNSEELIKKIREDIKKHKKGNINLFPSYFAYMKEFQIPSRKKVRELMMKYLEKEEVEYVNNFWKDFMKDRFSREGWVKKEIIGDYAEKLVKEKLEAEGWEVLKIFEYVNKEKKGWLKFNWEQLEKRNKEICKKLYSLSRWRSCYLPDFICFKKDFFKFVEVKAGKRVKWDKKQLKGIEKLEELGYVVDILKPVFFEKEIKNLLGEK